MLLTLDQIQVTLTSTHENSFAKEKKKKNEYYRQDENRNLIYSRNKLLDTLGIWYESY